MKNRTYGVFIIILSLLALMCIGYLLKLNFDAQKGVETSKKFAKKIVKEYEGGVRDGNGIKGVLESSNILIDEPLFRQIDFDELKRQNSDIDSWLYLPNSNIDYPVVMEPEVGAYHYDLIGFDGKYNGCGTPLIPKAPDGKTDFRTLILAHRMVNYWGDEDWLFSHLPNRFKTLDDAKNHLYVYTYKPDGKSYRWKVWSSGSANSLDMIYETPYLKGDDSYGSLIDHIEFISDYTIGIKPDDSTPILQLSTCTRSGDNTDKERFVVSLVLDKIYDKNTGKLFDFEDLYN